MNKHADSQPANRLVNDVAKTMTHSRASFSLCDDASDVIERQARAWMRRVASGEMTHSDGIALRQWCQTDPAHAAAFGVLRRRWALVQAAGDLSAARQPVASPARRLVPPRRAFLGGAAGFAAAAVGVAVVHPPWGLWPSADELRADYRTGTGERRQLVLGDDVNVELNTRTSIATHAAEGGRDAGFELIAGEAAVDLAHVRRRFTVDIGRSRVTAREARFEVRRGAADICVSCVTGQVDIAHAAGKLTLQALQQVRFDDAAIGRVTAVDLARLSAWREGFLRFVDTPLGEVVEEINRYRPGRLVLLDSKLAARRVTGRFQVAALDRAIAQIQHSLGLAVRSLPGGVLLLS